jgi:hypothetical protein
MFTGLTSNQRKINRQKTKVSIQSVRWQNSNAMKKTAEEKDRLAIGDT